MKVAELLSDLTSLQVCEPNAALALVSVEPESSSKDGTRKGHDNDSDLRRAKDLVELHADVKLAHQDGMDRELNAAREAVAKVLRAL